MGVEPIWEPSPERVERANITRYLHWLRDRRGLRFASYDELWRWSVEDLDGFWTSIWEFFEVGGPAPTPGPGRAADAGGALVPRGDAQPRRAVAAPPRRPPGAAVRQRGRRAGHDQLRRAGPAGGGGRGRAAPARGRQGRPGRRLPAQRARDGDRLAGHGEHRGDLVELRPRVRRLQRGRPLRPDRAQGAGRGRRLPLRRRLARPARRPGRDPPAAPDPEGHRPRRRLRPGGSAGSRRPRPGLRERHRGLGPAAGGGGRGRAGIRAGGLRPSAVGAVLLGHHRAAQGDRPRPRRDRPRAAEVASRCSWTLGRPTGSSGSPPPAG